MRALLVKEWRQVQPVVGLGVASAVLSWTVLADPRAIFLAPRADVQGPVWLGMLVAGAALGFWQLAGERSGGTLELLLQRPAPSRRLVGAKAGVAWLALALAGPLAVLIAWWNARHGRDGPALQPGRAVELAALATAGAAGHGLGMLCATLKAPTRRQAALLGVLLLGVALPVGALWARPWGVPSVRVGLFAASHLALAAACLGLSSAGLRGGSDVARPLPGGRALTLGGLLLALLAPAVWFGAAFTEGVAVRWLRDGYPKLWWMPGHGLCTARDPLTLSARVLLPYHELDDVEGAESLLWTGAARAGWLHLLGNAIGRSWRVGERWQALPVHLDSHRFVRPREYLARAWLDETSGGLRVVYLAPPLAPAAPAPWMRVAPLQALVTKPDGTRFSTEVGSFRIAGYGPFPDPYTPIFGDARDGTMWRLDLDDPADVLHAVAPPSGRMPTFVVRRTPPRDDEPRGRFAWSGREWVPTPRDLPRLRAGPPPFEVRETGDPLRPRLRVAGPDGGVLLEIAHRPGTPGQWIAWAVAQLAFLARPPAAVVAALVSRDPTLHPAGFAPAIALLVADGRRPDLVVLSFGLAAGLALRMHALLRRRRASPVLRWAWPAAVLVTGPVGYAALALTEPLPESRPRTAAIKRSAGHVLREEVLA